MLLILVENQLHQHALDNNTLDSQNMVIFLHEDHDKLYDLHLIKVFRQINYKFQVLAKIQDTYFYKKERKIDYFIKLTCNKDII